MIPRKKKVTFADEAPALSTGIKGLNCSTPATVCDINDNIPSVNALEHTDTVSFETLESLKHHLSSEERIAYAWKCIASNPRSIDLVKLIANGAKVVEYLGEAFLTIDWAAKAPDIRLLIYAYCMTSDLLLRMPAPQQVAFILLVKSNLRCCLNLKITPHLLNSLSLLALNFLVFNMNLSPFDFDATLRSDAREILKKRAFSEDLPNFNETSKSILLFFIESHLQQPSDVLLTLDQLSISLKTEYDSRGESYRTQMLKKFVDDLPEDSTSIYGASNISNRCKAVKSLTPQEFASLFTKLLASYSEIKLDYQDHPNFFHRTSTVKLKLLASVLTCLKIIWTDNKPENEWKLFQTITSDSTPTSVCDTKAALASRFFISTSSDDAVYGQNFTDRVGFSG